MVNNSESFLNITSENELIKRWSPVVYFHTEEKYFPCSIDWILKNSNNYKSQIQIYNDFINTKISNTDIHIRFNKEFYKGEKYFDNVPTYVYLSYRPNKIYIRYIFIHAYNGHYNILNLFNTGAHEGDLEHIVVELNKDKKLNRVFLSAHTRMEGKWVSKENLSFENGRIVVFSALNGHGLYEKEGVALRYFGIANDYLSKGRRWEPYTERIYAIYDENFNPKTMGAFCFWKDSNYNVVLGDEYGTKINDFTTIIKSNKNQYYPTIYDHEIIAWMKILLFYIFLKFLFLVCYMVSFYNFFYKDEKVVKEM